MEQKMYHCKHCDANLDKGDIYQHFRNKYPQKSDEEIRKIAGRYGWSETNKLHFLASVIVQPEGYTQYNMCPACKGKEPLPSYVY